MTDIRPIPPAATPPAGNQGAAPPAPTPASAAASAVSAASTPAGDAQAGGQPPVAAAPSPSTVTTPDDSDNPLLEGQPDNLKELYRKLPPEIRAANNKIVTEKFQKISGDAKIIEALKTNPKEFAAALNDKLGLRVQPTPTEAAAAAKSMTEELTPFFEGNAQAAAAFEGLLTKVIESKLAPIQETQQQAINNHLLAEAQASEARFISKHPDAKQFEAQIGEYMTKVQPGPDVSDDEFLEMAYSWATRGRTSAASVVATVERLADASAAMAGNPQRNAEGAPIGATPPSDNITPAMAVAAAIRGERWER